MSAAPSNIAGKLAAVFVDSRLTPLFILALVLLGAVINAVMPREENPQILIPGAEIVVPLPGASAQEVEQQLIRPLEDMVKGITGVENVHAAALPSLAVLNVQFFPGENKQKALIALQDRVQGHRERLPPDAGAVQIRSVEMDDVPIVAVTLASATYDDYALKRLADRLVDGLRSLESVSATTVKGGRDREMRIEIDPARLQTFGFTLDQLRGALASANVSGPLGATVRQGQQRNVQLDGFIRSADELRRLIVGVYQGRPIYLDDVARVIDGPPEERERVSRFGFGRGDVRSADPFLADPMPAVTLTVAKKPGTNAVVVSREVLERIERMKAQFVPSGVELVVTRDDGRKAEAAVNVLLEHFVIAVGVVFLVCAVFLGLKEALIVVLTVPLVLVLTLGACHLFGMTINRVTLFAMILSLGLLVDAGIVVIENIHRHLGGLTDLTDLPDLHGLATTATNEIGHPTNLATLAVMLVFASMLTTGGMMGQYFRPIGFGVTVAMAASLLVAYIVVPWAAARWLRPHRGLPSKAGGSKRPLHVYRGALTAVLRSPARGRRLFVVVGVLLALSLMQPAWQFVRPSGPGGPVSWFGVALSLMTKDNKNTFNISIDMPPSATVQDTDRLAREVGALLREHAMVSNYQTWIGEAGVIDFAGLLRGASGKAGPNVAEIRVNLVDKARRDVSSMTIVRELRPAVQRLAAAVPGVTVQLVEEPPGPALRATLMAEIYGHDLAQLRAISGQVQAVFHSTYDVAEVTRTEQHDAAQDHLVVDREKAALSGVSVAQVGMVLRRLIAGEVLGQAHLPGEKNPVPIRLHVPQRFQIDPARLAGLSITNAQGKVVPLSELVRLESGWLDRPVLRKNGERVTFVGAELTGTPWLPAILDLDRRLDGLPLAGGERLPTANLRFNPVAPDVIDGPRLLWDGEPRLTLSVYRDMLVAMGAAVVCIFLMLVAYYRAFDLPLVAMSALPLGLIGVFPGHWLMGGDFSATSMVGVIALAGIVVRNSLLIIDFTLAHMRAGLSVHDAIVEAGSVRLRPIVLTALAIVLGSAVMLNDPVFSGLAISMIFGTLSSTVLTIVVVPAILLRVLGRQPSIASRRAAHEA